VGNPNVWVPWARSDRRERPGAARNKEESPKEVQQRPGTAPGLGTLQERSVARNRPEREGKGVRSVHEPFPRKSELMRMRGARTKLENGEKSEIEVGNKEVMGRPLTLSINCRTSVYSPLDNSTSLSCPHLRALDRELPRASAITVGQRSIHLSSPLHLLCVRFSDSVGLRVGEVRHSSRLAHST
jgi:hypothetical protein